jgi:hypothetical protein
MTLIERVASERRAEEIEERVLRVERMKAALNDICSNCGGTYSTDDHTDDCRREAAALLVWNAPADDTGRSVLR